MSRSAVRGAIALALLLIGQGGPGAAQAAGLALFELTLSQAERRSLDSSNQYKATQADEAGAQELASSQLMTLLPQLSLSGTYQHLGTVPTLSVLPNMPPLQFESNTSYSIGPVLKYTLWDTFSGLKTYRGYSRLAEARGEDRRNEKLQLLYSTRAAYVQVQLGLEQLRLIKGSLELARAQDRDIATRVSAGAASRLDRVTSERTVLSFEIQFEQRQAELSSALKDLLALVGDERAPTDLSHPGPPGAANVTLVLKLDGLEDTLSRELGERAAQPNPRHPQIRSLELQAEAAEYAAGSATSRLLPVAVVSAKTSLDYPNGPVFQQIHQNTLAVSVTMPLFLGDPTWAQAAQQRRAADSARFREEQLKINLARDFAKAGETLDSLLVQRTLAARDVKQSGEAARLFYISYKAGRNNILDVQTANNQELQAKVNAAAIDAQILDQLVTLKALSGKEAEHD